MGNVISSFSTFVDYQNTCIKQKWQKQKLGTEYRSNSVLIYHIDPASNVFAHVSAVAHTYMVQCTWASCFVSLRYIVFLFRIKIYVLLICLEYFYKYICLFIVAWQIEIDIFSLYINPELIYPTNYFLNLSWASLPVFVSPGLSLSI